MLEVEVEVETTSNQRAAGSTVSLFAPECSLKIQM